MQYNCHCKKSNFSDKNYTYWEDRPVTTDEIDIINFLKKNNKSKFKSILHIGIGNSYFANIFNDNNSIIGITVSQKEILKAKSFNLPNYKVYLCDKYSIAFNNITSKNKFDLVVDANLKSYSCCQKSFEIMMENIFQSMNSNGMIITSINGMKWVKKLKPKLTFTFKKLFHFKLKEINGNELNILTINELKKLSKKYNLKISFDEKLCYLTK